MIDLQALTVSLLVGTGFVIISYYIIINIYYLIVHVLALFELRDSTNESEWKPPFYPFGSPFYPGIAMVVPAYNEEASIVESVRSMLTLNYPDQEIVVVNDGSTDRTLEQLQKAFKLEAVAAPVPYDVPAKPIRGVYRSTRYEDLLVIDKENGGKSDALNAGVWLTEQKLFCAVDADTVIDRNALLQIVRPFLEDPEKAVASGGTIRVANDCTISDGEVTEVTLPKTGLAGLQVMEYLRAFYSGRLGLSRLKGLVLISGAFGIFRTDYVRAIGGYRHDTITEDLDLVVRLHKYLCDEEIEYTVDFIAEPVAWTEVPESFRVLGRQRRRWYRGMVETAVTNREMLFNRKYGRVGTVILPFFIAAEAFGPLIEGLGYILLPLAWYLGILSIEFFLAFFLLTTGFGVFLSWFGIASEVLSFNRYDDPRDILRLLWYGILENFGYRQWKTVVAWQGLLEYLRGENSWGVMERKGFGGGVDGGPDVDVDVDTDTNSAGSAPGEAGALASGAATAARVDTSGFIWVQNPIEREPAFGVIDGGVDGEGVGEGENEGEEDGESTDDGGFIWTSLPVTERTPADDTGFIWVSVPIAAVDEEDIQSDQVVRDDSNLEMTGDERLDDGGFIWTSLPITDTGLLSEEAPREAHEDRFRD